MIVENLCVQNTPISPVLKGVTTDILVQSIF
jgi:hypothetical protein